MHRIGLTGSIASGKSTVSTMLAELGAYIIDADKIAREVVQPGQKAWHDIIKVFGKGILMADCHIDRTKLGEIIFGDEDARDTLNGITHPQIEEHMIRAINSAKSDGHQNIVLDVPLLIEAGWQYMTDEIWVVYVDSHVQIQRLMARNNISYEQALARISSQMSMKEKIKYADVIIDNNGALEATLLQVINEWQRLTKDRLE